MIEPNEVIGEAIGEFILLLVVLAAGALIGAVAMGAWIQAHPSPPPCAAAEP